MLFSRSSMSLEDLLSVVTTYSHSIYDNITAPGVCMLKATSKRLNEILKCIEKHVEKDVGPNLHMPKAFARYAARDDFPRFLQIVNIGLDFDMNGAFYRAARHKSTRCLMWIIDFINTKNDLKLIYTYLIVIAKGISHSNERSTLVDLLSHHLGDVLRKRMFYKAMIYIKIDEAFMLDLTLKMIDVLKLPIGVNGPQQNFEFVFSNLLHGRYIKTFENIMTRYIANNAAANDIQILNVLSHTLNVQDDNGELFALVMDHVNHIVTIDKVLEHVLSVPKVCALYRMTPSSTRVSEILPIRNANVFATRKWLFRESARRYFVNDGVKMFASTARILFSGIKYPICERIYDILMNIHDFRIVYMEHWLIIVE